MKSALASLALLLTLLISFAALPAHANFPRSEAEEVENMRAQCAKRAYSVFYRHLPGPAEAIPCRRIQTNYDYTSALEQLRCAEELIQNQPNFTGDDLDRHCGIVSAAK